MTVQGSHQRGGLGGRGASLPSRGGRENFLFFVELAGGSGTQVYIGTTIGKGTCTHSRTTMDFITGRGRDTIGFLQLTRTVRQDYYGSFTHSFNKDTILIPGRDFILLYKRRTQHGHVGTGTSQHGVRYRPFHRVLGDHLYHKVDKGSYRQPMDIR